MTQLLAHLFGDYILQSDWMAQGKTKRSWPALAHALLYSLCFVPLCWQASYLTSAWKSCYASGGEIVCVSMPGFPLVVNGHSFHWMALLVIFSTHFLIDRFRLARYVVWAKNWMGPWVPWWIRDGKWFNSVDQFNDHVPSEGCCEPPAYVVRPTPTLAACPTGYPPTTPIWLSTWLLIIADNTLHLAINYAALRWL